MEVAATIKSIKDAMGLKELVSVFIVPVNNYSVNYEKTLPLEEIIEINKIKPTFIVVNKNIHNSEIEEIKNLLQEIEKHKFAGIIFYDIAIVNLKQKLDLKTPLVWAQEHLTTNYQTINYWFDKGAEYAYLSSELTKEEMDEIKANTKAKLFVNVFGYLPMFTSRRHLVNNYLETFNLKTKDKTKIYKEDKYYQISDKENGTVVYSDYVLNALDIDFNRYDYIVFNSNLINEEDFYDTLVKFKTKKNEYKFPYEHGFLYKETIYKVKDND